MMDPVIVFGGLGVAAFVAIWIGSVHSDLKRKREGVQIEMIRARIMLLSTDTKEIQEFLENKESYITQEMINQLINRVAEIKAEEVIDKDWAKKAQQMEKV
jgi:hypothetical protein